MINPTQGILAFAGPGIAVPSPSTSPSFHSRSGLCGLEIPADGRQLNLCRRLESLDTLTFAERDWLQSVDAPCPIGINSATWDDMRLVVEVVIIHDRPGRREAEALKSRNLQEPRARWSMISRP